MPAAPTQKRNTKHTDTAHTLAIDVGGTGLKASVLDGRGQMLVERVRVDTPVGAAPRVIVDTLVQLVASLPAFDRVSVGFPGVVRNGRIITAPNLGNAAWTGFDLASALTSRLKRPVRVANDADIQGLAVIRGKGLEMVITLGTGFGTGVYSDGQLAPHLEIAHLPFRKGKTFDQQLGNRARKNVGDAKWSERVVKAIEILHTLTHFDRLYVGGGNARKLTLQLPASCEIISNDAGITGGVVLWKTA
jgi:polyphosphate glucokinase